MRAAVDDPQIALWKRARPEGLGPFEIFLPWGTVSDELDQTTRPRETRGKLWPSRAAEGGVERARAVRAPLEWSCARALPCAVCERERAE